MADGFIVVEGSDDFFGPLTLREGPDLPPGGILDFQAGKDPVAVFPTRRAARAAITRTRHYAIAFGRNVESGHCLPTAYETRILPVHQASETPQGGKA